MLNAFEENNIIPFEEFQRLASRGNGDLTLDDFKRAAEANKPQPSSIKEWAKMVPRSFMEAGNMVNRGIETASNVVGQSLGVRPEDNPVSQWQRDVVRSGERIHDVDLGKNEQWAKEHGGQNFGMEMIEGALPYVELAAVPGGGAALPYIAGASTHAKLTNKMMDKGIDSGEAMFKAAPAALAETALFAAMHGANKYVMGGKNAEGVFEQGKAVDLLKKPFTKNPLVGDLTKEATPLQTIGREAAFAGPYLHAQSEAIQGLEAATGATPYQEYQQQHGVDPNASTLENVGNVALNQVKGLGTSAVMGAGFGALPALKQIAEAKKQGAVDAAKEVLRKRQEDTANRNIATDLTGNAPTIDEVRREESDNNKLGVIEEDLNNNLQAIDQQLIDLSPKAISESESLDSSSLGSIQAKPIENQSDLDSMNQGSNQEVSRSILQIPENSVKPLNEENGKEEYHSTLQEHASHPTIQAVTDLVNTVNNERGSALVAPEYMVNAVKKLHSTAKNIKEFTAGLVQRFGESIKQHAIKLWNLAKEWAKKATEFTKAKLSDERGLVGLDVGEEKTKHKRLGLPEDFEGPIKFTRNPELDAERARLKSESDTRIDKARQKGFSVKEIRTDNARSLEDFDIDSSIIPERRDINLSKRLGDATLAPEFDQDRSQFHAQEYEMQKWLDKESNEKRYQKELKARPGLTREQFYLEERKGEPKDSLESDEVADFNNRYDESWDYGIDKEDTQRASSVRKQRDGEYTGFSTEIKDELDRIPASGGKINKRKDKQAQLDAYNKSVDQKLKQVALQLQSNKSEKLNGTLGRLNNMPVKDYIVKALSLFTKHDGKSHTLDIDKTLDYITKNNGSPSKWKEIPQEFFDIERYVLSLKGERRKETLLAEDAQRENYHEDVLEPFHSDSPFSSTLKEMINVGPSKRNPGYVNRNAILSVLKSPQKMLDVIENYIASSRGAKASDLNKLDIAQITKELNRVYSKDITNNEDARTNIRELADKFEQLHGAKEAAFHPDFVTKLVHNFDKLKEQHLKNTVENHSEGLTDEQHGGAWYSKTKQETSESHIREIKPDERDPKEKNLSNKQRKKLVEDQYKVFKRESSSDKTAYDVMPEFFDAISSIANEGIQAKARAIDVNRIATIMYGKAEAKSEFRKLSNEQRADIVRRLLKSTEIPDGYFDFKTDSDVSVNEETGVINSTYLNPEGKIVRDGYKTNAEGKVIKEGDEIAHSSYPVSESKDQLRSVNQLGELGEVEPVGVVEQRRNKQALVNDSEELMLKVEYTRKDGKTRQEKVTLSGYKALKKNFPNIKVLEQLHGGLTKTHLEKWNPLPEERRIANIAREQGLISGQDGVAIRRLIDKIEKTEDGTLKNEARRELAKVLLPYKVELARRAFEKVKILDSDFFEKQAKEYSDLGLSAAEHYKEYLDAYGDMGIYKARLTNRLEKFWQDKADKLLERIVQISKSEKDLKSESSVVRNDSRLLDKNIRDYVTTRLSEGELADYKKMMTNTRVHIGEKQYPIEDTLPLARRVKLVALRDIENQIKAIGFKQFNNKTSIATEKSNRQIKPDITDIFRSKSEGELSDFEKSLGVQSVGRLSNDIAQGFYNLVAKAFGADLVVVSDPQYRSRYIGKASDGRSKIVINANSDTSFARLYAHEMFHHVVRKVAGEEYSAFKDSLKFIVGEDKWNAAIADMQRKHFSEFNTPEGSKEFEASSYNYKGRLDVRTLENNMGGWTKETYEHGLKAGEIPPEKRAEIEEELLANIFEHAVTQKSFYDHLASTGKGKPLASRLLTRLIQKSFEIREALKYGKENARENTLGFMYEKQVLLKQMEMDGVNELIGDLLGKAYTSTRFNSELANERFWTDLKGAKKFASETLEKAFPEGSRDRKGIMDSIEKLASKALQWIKDNKPKGIYADFMSDPEQIRLASKVMHGIEYEAAKAQQGIIEKYKDVWRGMSNEQLEKVHDDFVRFNRFDVLSEQGKLEAKKAGYTDRQIEVFGEYKKTSDALYAQLRELYPDLPERASHFGQSIKWFKKKGGTILDDSFDWIVNPEMSKLEGDKQYLKFKDEKRTTRKIAEDHSLEYNTINPHEMFLEYVRDANKLIKLHEMIQEGQNSDAVRIFTDQAAANKQGFVPVADNATKIFQKLNPTMGYKILTGDGWYEREGHEVVYKTEQDAISDMKRYGLDGEVEAIKPEKDNAPTHWSVMRSFKVPKVDANGVEITKNGKTVYETHSEEIRSFTFDKQAEAEKYLETLKPEGDTTAYHLEQKSFKNDDAVISRLYFKPDLARMINVVLAQDKLRNGSLFGVSGKQVMDVKNSFSAIEFAGSIFHAMTIGQEAISSGGTWSADRYGRYNITGQKDYAKKYSGYNVVKLVKDSKDMVAIFNAVLGNEKLAYDSAIQKKMDSLLGTHNVDVLDVLKQFYNTGGIQGLDTSLKGTIHEHEFRYKSGDGSVKIQNGDVVIGRQKFSFDEVRDSVKEAWDKEIKNHGKLIGGLRASAFTALKPTTQWLMEEGIPKIKMAMFAREYTLKLDKNTEKLKAGLITREEIARDTMKFIEDRFGEVNWKNMWMDPSIKTALQFTFRSFTWFTGSWKALGKAGIDIGKWGWFKAKGEKYEITEKGMWGVNAILAHALTAGLITGAYQLFNLGTDEVATEEDTPELTRLMFPRIDPYDPSKRVAIPSYVTEAWKIFNHLGLMGGQAEPSKLLAGRFNSILGKGIEALYTNEDFRGVTVHNREDSYPKQAMDMILHMIPAPIMFSSIAGDWRDRGPNVQSLATSFLGMTDAPAAAKRSVATNKAFELRRQEYKGKAITPEQMKEKDALKRAMHSYQMGDKTEIDELLHEGKISPRQYDIALTKIPRVGGSLNPKFKDPLSQALQGLTMEGALKTWDKMTDNERSKHKGEIMKKYMNMNARQDKSPEEKQEIRKQMKEFGLI